MLKFFSRGLRSLLDAVGLLLGGVLVVLVCSAHLVILLTPYALTGVYAWAGYKVFHLGLPWWESIPLFGALTVVFIVLLGVASYVEDWSRRLYYRVL